MSTQNDSPEGAALQQPAVSVAETELVEKLAEAMQAAMYGQLGDKIETIYGESLYAPEDWIRDGVNKCVGLAYDYAQSLLGSKDKEIAELRALLADWLALGENIQSDDDDNGKTNSRTSYLDEPIERTRAALTPASPKTTEEAT